MLFACLFFLKSIIHPRIFIVKDRFFMSEITKFHANYSKRALNSLPFLLCTVLTSRNLDPSMMLKNFSPLSFPKEEF